MKINILSILFMFAIINAGLIVPIPINIEYDKEKAFLGQKLFSDTRLSKDNSISCESCHLLNQGGDDNIQYSFGINGQIGEINSPTVFNARFNLSQFWDGRSIDLKDQAQHPIANPVEMGSSLEEVISKLEKDGEFKAEFTKVYSEGFTKDSITDAIAEFEKALVTPNSRFDQFLRGDKHAITQFEKDGFKLFKENGCISCHNGINIGGNLYQKVGVLINYRDAKNQLGRFNVTRLEKDKYLFKVPTLRNIADTAPYLHDGTVETLDDIVKFMIMYQVGMIPDDLEIKKISAFLKTLSGQTPKILEENNEK